MRAAEKEKGLLNAGINKAELKRAGERK